MSGSRSSDLPPAPSPPDRAAAGPRPPPARGGLPVPAGAGEVEERCAGGVVVRSLGDRLHILLIRDPYGRWGLPKGHLEEGEGSEEAALREVGEETGLGDLELGADLGEISWSFRADRILVRKSCRFFLMRSALDDATPEVSEGITECRWLGADEALEVISYGNARAIVARAIRCLSGPPGAGGPVPR